MPGWKVMHLLYLGGAKGGAIVRLYHNGGYDEPVNANIKVSHLAEKRS